MFFETHKTLHHTTTFQTPLEACYIKELGKQGKGEKKHELNVLLLMSREFLLCMCYDKANSSVPVKQPQLTEKQHIQYAGFIQRDRFIIFKVEIVGENAVIKARCSSRHFLFMKSRVVSLYGDF